jgi:hypothetical protein
VFIFGLLSVLSDQPSPPPDGAAPLLELPPDEPPPLAVQAVSVIAVAGADAHREYSSGKQPQIGQMDTDQTRSKFWIPGSLL